MATTLQAVAVGLRVGLTLVFVWWIGRAHGWLLGTFALLMFANAELTTLLYRAQQAKLAALEQLLQASLTMTTDQLIRRMG